MMIKNETVELKHLTEGALVTVVLPFSSVQRHDAKKLTGWRPLQELNLEVNSNIFPDPVWVDHPAPPLVEGNNVESARLHRLNANTAFLEFTVRLPNWPNIPEEDLRNIFDSLCRFQNEAVEKFSTDHAPSLIKWSKECLGNQFKIAWHFTINLISVAEDPARFDYEALSKKAQNITGPESASKEFNEYHSNKIKSIMMGETGGWLKLRDNPTQIEIETARFWLGRLALAYSTIQSCFELLMENRQALLTKQNITSQEFSNFVSLKQSIVGFIFEISPGSNAGRAMDIQIYKYGYAGWSLDDDLNQMLSMLNHLEGIVMNFEDKRRRREARFFTIVATLITLSGLYAVLQYLYEFFGRHGFESSIALVVDFFGALGVTSVITLFLFWFLFRRGE